MADGEWQVCHDDGFVYKRRKRLQDASFSFSSDPKAEARQRREQKRRILLKLKDQYKREIEQWEGLLATLQQLKEKSCQAEASTPKEPSDSERTLEDGISQPIILDELLLQAEAQEAILQDLLNLCDVAETSCKVQEERLKQSFIDLPIWATPQALMASLSEVDDGENDHNNS